MKIKEIMKEYKDVTEEIIKRIDNDENFEDLVNKRQEFLEQIKSEDFQVEDLRKVVEELEILELEKRVSKKVLEEKEKVKEEIKNTQKQRVAHNSYGNNFGDFSFFNKKI